MLADGGMSLFCRARISLRGGLSSRRRVSSDGRTRNTGIINDPPPFYHLNHRPWSRECAFGVHIIQTIERTEDRKESTVSTKHE